MLRGAVLQASRFAQRFLARVDDEVTQDVWIARETDQKQIGDPIAQVVGRRGMAGELAPDVANLIEAAIGVAAYVSFHATKAWQLRREHKIRNSMMTTPDTDATPEV